MLHSAHTQSVTRECSQQHNDPTSASTNAPTAVEHSPTEHANTAEERKHAGRPVATELLNTSSAFVRVGKQCRERWNNHLCPEVKKSEWSEKEDMAIVQGVSELGTRWCEIIKAPALAGRTDNAIKNRYYALQRRVGRQNAVGEATID